MKGGNTFIAFLQGKYNVDRLKIQCRQIDENAYSSIVVPDLVHVKVGVLEEREHVARIDVVYMSSGGYGTMLLELICKRRNCGRTGSSTIAS